MIAALQFVGGDELIESFLMNDDDGNIQDLAGLTISGAVWWREKERIPLSTGGGGLSVTNTAPTLAYLGQDQDPHGFIALVETQTIGIPFGQVASIRLKAVGVDGVTMSTFFAPLERLA